MIKVSKKELKKTLEMIHLEDRDYGSGVCVCIRRCISNMETRNMLINTLKKLYNTRSNPLRHTSFFLGQKSFFGWRDNLLFSKVSKSHGLRETAFLFMIYYLIEKNKLEVTEDTEQIEKPFIVYSLQK